MLKFTWVFRLILLLTAGLILAQCSGSLPVKQGTAQPTPSNPIATAYPPAALNIPGQTLPYPAPPILEPVYPAPSVPVTAYPALPTLTIPTAVPWQTITDPQKLWSLQIPPDWSSGKAPGEYLGEDGFIRITYLPEMAYMQQARRVCERLANSPVGQAENWDWLGVARWICASCHLRKARSQPRTG